MLIEIPDNMVDRILQELSDLSVVDYPILTRLWPLFQQSQVTEVILQGNLLSHVTRQGKKLIGMHGKKVDAEYIEMNHIKITSGNKVSFYRIIQSDYSEQAPRHKLELVE